MNAGLVRTEYGILLAAKRVFFSYVDLAQLLRILMKQTKQAFDQQPCQLDDTLLTILLKNRVFTDTEVLSHGRLAFQSKRR